MPTALSFLLIFFLRHKPAQRKGNIPMHCLVISCIPILYDSLQLFPKFDSLPIMTARVQWRSQGYSWAFHGIPMIWPNKKSDIHIHSPGSSPGNRPREVEPTARSPQLVHQQDRPSCRCRRRRCSDNRTSHQHGSTSRRPAIRKSHSLGYSACGLALVPSLVVTV